MGDELIDTPDENISDSVTDNTDKETKDEKIVRLTEENKKIKDGNSQLGRDFKAYKEDNEGQYSVLLDKMTEMTALSPANNNVPLVDEYEDEEEKRLAAIADRRYEEGERKKVAIDKQYISDYSKAMQSLGKNEDAEVYEAILTEVEGMAGFSNNGAEDALRHFQKAEAQVYKSKYRQVSNNGNNTAFREQAPTGQMGGSSTVVTKESIDTEVVEAEKDPSVQDYMKWRNRRKGNDPEFLKKALSAEKKLSGKVKI